MKAAMARIAGSMKTMACQCTVLALALAGVMLVTPAAAVVTNGATQGVLNATESGAAVYGIPISLPRGTGAVVPAGLALNYSSQGDNGLAGQGFDIGGLPVISRCARTIVTDGIAGSVNFDANDRFCMHGQRLILISGTYGGDGAEYRGEVNSYGNKVISYGVAAGGGPAWFKVWDKSGLIYEYGNSADSRIEAQGKTVARRWALNKAYDRVGNYYTVSYAEDNVNGQYYPTRIDYTGNATAALAPYASVRFAYETRPDKLPMYQAGSLVKSTVRLTKIQTYTAVANVDTLVREYRLTYMPADATQPSRLQSVTECGMEGAVEVCLNPTTFTWVGGGRGGLFTLTSNFVPSPNPYDRSQYTTSRYADVNGDGKIDFCFRDAQGVICYPSGSNVYSASFRGPNWSDALGWGSDNDGGANPQNGTVDKASYYSTIQFPDLDADGKADACARSARGVECWINMGGSFQLLYLSNLMTDAAGWNRRQYYSTIQYPDINADGKADLCGRDRNGIICYTGNGYGSFVFAYRGPNWSDTSGWGSDTDLKYTLLGVTQYFSKYYTTISFPDLNGDGKADVCGRFQTGIQCALNTGSGFGAEFMLHSVSEALSDTAGWWESEYYSTISYPDLNKDGKADVCARSGAGLACWLNTGADVAVTAKFSGPAWSDANGWNKAKHYATIQYSDVNSDGIADVCARNSQGIECWLGTGSGFISKFDGPRMQDPAYDGEANYSSIRFIDFNGDGQSDVCELGKCWSSGGYSGFGVSPPLLSSVVDGLNKQTTVTYKPLTDSSVYTRSNVSDRPFNVMIRRNVQSPLYVVATTEAGGLYLGNTQTSSRANYKYWAALAENTGRGYLGFAAVEVTDPATNIVNRTELRQDFPFIGQVKRSERRIGTTKLFEADHTAAFSGNSVYVAYPIKTIAKNYDLDGTLINTVTTTSSQDLYGNPTYTTVTTVAQNLVTGVSETHTDALDRGYFVDTANWLVNKLGVIRATRTLPDGTSQTRTSSFIYEPVTGLLKQEIIEPNDPVLKRTTNYIAFDSFGNARNVEITGASIRLRANNILWDSKGRFMTYKNNEAGLPTWYLHDERFGSVSQIKDANLLVTNITYDALGREKTRTTPDGTTVTNIYGAASACAVCLGVTTTVRNGTTVVAPDKKTDFDFLGRPVRVIIPAYNGQNTVQATEYDNRGRVFRKSRQVIDSGPWTGYSWTTYTYDVLDRVKTVTGPDGAVVATAYKGLTTNITYPNGFTGIRIANGIGQTIKTTDPVNAGRSTSQLFTYDHFGNLRTSQDAAGNTVTMTYDIMGRKLTQSDPDMGNWSWNYFPYNFLVDAVVVTSPRGTIETRYDTLGRPTDYKSSDLTARWVYDRATGSGKGKLWGTYTEPFSGQQPYPTSGYNRTLTYDALGRVQRTDTTIDGVVYATQTTYDAASRPDTVTYPKGVQVKHTYNSLGYPLEVKNAATGLNYWQMQAMDAEGNIAIEILGNGLYTNRTFNYATGRVERISTGAWWETNPTTQNATYTWDNMGNLLTRADAAAGISEGPFTYDAMNRLTSSPVAGVGTKNYIYDDLGNLTHRSDVGSYSYAGPRPHAVKSISGTINRSFSYDASGNLLSDGVRSYTWSQFNMPATITKDGQTTSFTYGSERQRIKQVSPGRTIIYAGSGFEVEIAGATTTYKNYIAAGNGLVAVVTQDAGNTVTATRYVHRDHLGSASVITNESGAVLERLSYDPYGKRRLPNGADDPGNVLTSAHSRSGFTGHEQLDELDLVHMNGRVYDPVSARFISPDPFVQAPYNTQSYNRYSYVINNPLTLIDPSGYNWLSDRWQEGWDDIKGGVNTITSNFHFNDLADSIRDSDALQVVVGLAACGAPGGVGVATCAAYNVYLAKLHGASNMDALFAGSMAGGMAIAFTAVGDMGYGAATWQNALAHGAVGGIFGYATTGSATAARSGFAGGFVGEYYSNFGIGGAMLGGGVGSRLSGGTFWSGARTGAYGYIFNQAAHAGVAAGAGEAVGGTSLFGRFWAGIRALVSPLGWATILSGDTPQADLYMHYGYAANAESFGGGLNPGSYATEYGPPMTGAQAQQLLALPHPIPPDSYYTVRIAPSGSVPVIGPLRVQATEVPLRTGGGIEYRFPQGTPPGSVMGPYPVAR